MVAAQLQTEQLVAPRQGKEYFLFPTSSKLGHCGGGRFARERIDVHETSQGAYGFHRRSTPPAGEQVEVLYRKDGRVETLPLVCCWTLEDGWVVAGTRHKLQFEVVAWRWRR